MNRLLALILLTVLTFRIQAGEPPATLKISQARVSWPELVTYLDVRDTHGHPIGEINTNTLRVTLGNKTVPVKQIDPFEKTAEGVAYIVLVDVSKSMKADFFAHIRTALTEWVDGLNSADRMAILTFGNSVERIADFSRDKPNLRAIIASLKPADQHTALHQGLLNGIQLGQRADIDLPQRRVIVVLSDGQDDLIGGPVRDEVVQQLKTDRIPIYAIGLDKPPITGVRKEGIEALGRFARESGGDYISSADRAIGDVYTDLRRRINQVSVVKMKCLECYADGSIQRLQITLEEQGLALSDGMDIRLLPAATLSNPASVPPVVQNTSKEEITPDGLIDRLKSNPVWAFTLLGVIAVIIATAYLQIVRRTKQTPGQNSGSIPAYSDPVTAKQPSNPMPPPVLYRVRLVQISGPNQGQSYDAELADELIIGRSKTSQVVIEGDSQISGRHCALIRKGSDFFVRDLNSTNGTGVNGVNTNGDYFLQDGDILNLGATELRVLLLGKII